MDPAKDESYQEPWRPLMTGNEWWRQAKLKLANFIGAKKSAMGVSPFQVMEQGDETHCSILVYARRAPRWLIETKNDLQVLAAATREIGAKLQKGEKQFMATVELSKSEGLGCDYASLGTTTAMANWYRGRRGPARGPATLEPLKPIATGLFLTNLDAEEDERALVVCEQHLRSTGCSDAAIALSDVRERVIKRRLARAILINIEEPYRAAVPIQIGFLSLAYAIFGSLGLMPSKDGSQER